MGPKDNKDKDERLVENKSVPVNFTISVGAIFNCFVLRQSKLA